MKHVYDLRKAKHAVISVLATGFFGVIVLPILRLFLLSQGPRALSAAQEWVTGLLVPFLFAAWPRPEGSIGLEEPLTRYPFFLTLIQWASLVGLNLFVVIRGYSRYPWISGVSIVVIFAVVCYFLLGKFGLYFSLLRT